MRGVSTFRFISAAMLSSNLDVDNPGARQPVMQEQAVAIDQRPKYSATKQKNTDHCE